MPNWGQAGQGLLKGGSTGASMGSLFGPTGTAIGGLIGGGIGGISGLLSGGGEQNPQQQGQGMQGGPQWPGYDTVSNFTPQQMQLFQQQFGHMGPDSYLSRLAGGDQSQFAEMEAPAMQQFNELQGGLASRFSGMGSGARRSSGFQNAGTSAASQFAQQLQANRLGIRNQALSGLMDMSNQLLGQIPYSQMQQQPGGFQQFLMGAAPGFGKGASEWLLNHDWKSMFNPSSSGGIE